MNRIIPWKKKRFKKKTEETMSGPKYDTKVKKSILI